MKKRRPVVRVFGGIITLGVAALTGLAQSRSTIAATEDASAYEADMLRDPFVPLVRDGRIVSFGDARGASRGLGQTGAPVLYGIVWDAGGHSIALINDAEVQVGDTVSGYEVVDIREDAVMLRRAEKELELHLSSDKKPAGESAGTATSGR